MTNIEAASRIWAILERTQKPDYMCIDRQTLADREALNLAIEALKAQSDKDNNVLSKKDGDCISRKWCLAEYDRQHVGPPGGARRIIAEAPAILPTQMSGTSDFD